MASMPLHASSGPPKVLVVDDEPALRQVLDIAFRRQGFEVVCAPGVKGAIEALQQNPQPFPLVITDLMMPDGTGMDVLTAAKARSGATEVIVMTAYSTVDHALDAMKKGAYDFVTKPFSPKELVSRIRAVLRRRAPHLAGSPVEIGGVRLDPAAHTVTVKGQLVELGPTEFKLLQYMMHHPNRAMTREQLLNVLRGDHAALLDRTVDVYVRRLRAALGPAGEALIETVRGTGYKLTNQAK
jgi:two-component system phosphate regulon response regulator PhoB